MKCDETKPTCLRCAAQKRTCDGYPPPSHAVLSRRALAAAVRSASAPGPASRVLAGPQIPDDVACFDFFRHRTAPMTTSFFPSEFWSRGLLQVAHAHPAVWHAAVALGALHRRWELGFAPAEQHAAGFSGKAASAYARSVALARRIADPLVMLVLSLGLMAVTSVMGRWVENRVHGVAGLRLLREIRRETAACRAGLVGSEVASVAESFARLDLQNLTFSESRAPYPDPQCDSNEDVRADAESLGDVLMPGDRFDSFSQAGFHLFALSRRFLLFAGIYENMSYEEYRVAEDGIRRQLSLWEQMMKEHLQECRALGKDEDRPGLLTVKLYHVFLRLLLSVCVTGSQTAWDMCLPHFERIVALAGTILSRNRASHATLAFVSLEPGIIIPLYLTATRCRHPVLRRRALQLLRQANGQEGRWHSVGAAAVAERIMQVEEEGLIGTIPDEIYANLVALDVSRDTAFQKLAESRLTGETDEYWLGGDVRWTTTHTWDGVPIIAEGKRVVMTGITADLEVGRIQIDLMSWGGDSAVYRKGEEVVFSNRQARGPR